LRQITFGWIPDLVFQKGPTQSGPLHGLNQITSLGYPVLFGISRKRVVDYLIGGNSLPVDRDQATAVPVCMGSAKGMQNGPCS
jgi:dihydropteroate synthase